MTNRYPHLLSPFKVTENTVFRSRLSASATSTPFIQGPLGFPGDGMIHHYTELARNGASMVQFISNPWREKEERLKIPDSMDMAHMSSGYDYNDPVVQNVLCQLTEEMHGYGTKIVLAARLPMPAGYTLGGGDSVQQAASGWKPVKNKQLPKELIPEIFEETVKMLSRFKAWGFDGISVRCDTYLTTSEDTRTDEYGGSTVNRSRFLKEFFSRVREEFGKDFIIEGVMGAEQPHGYQGSALFGYSVEDTATFCREVENYVSFMQIREYDMAVSHPTGYTHEPNEHRSLDYCRRLKELGVKVPLSPNGGFQDPEIMEKAIADGVCELISCSRAFFADPDYYEKLRDGRGEDIVPCLNCNKCHGTYGPPWVSLCSVNPRYGMDHKVPMIDRTPARSKKVAVIGGGPAGMRAAIFAAQKGHHVTLFEKTGYLGGQLQHADYYKFKWPIKKYRLWLIRELDRLGVEVRMNCEPEPEDLIAEGFESLIAATGATPVKPPIEGADDPAIRTCHDVWGHEDEIGVNVVIVGGSEVGMETAIDLAQRGRNVTVITRQKELGHDCSKIHYITISFVKVDPKQGWGLMSPEWEKYDNLSGIVNAKTVKVTPNSVTYEQDGQTHTLACDTVIVGGGVRPNVEDAMKYGCVTPNFSMVGDVEGKGGTIYRCNRSAYIKVNML